MHVGQRKQGGTRGKVLVSGLRRGERITYLGKYNKQWPRLAAGKASKNGLDDFGNTDVRRRCPCRRSSIFQLPWYRVFSGLRRGARVPIPMTGGVPLCVVLWRAWGLLASTRPATSHLGPLVFHCSESADKTWPESTGTMFEFRRRAAGGQNAAKLACPAWPWSGSQSPGDSQHSGSKSGLLLNQHTRSPIYPGLSLSRSACDMAFKRLRSPRSTLRICSLARLCGQKSKAAPEILTGEP